MFTKAGLAAGAVVLALAPCTGSAQVLTQHDISWKLGFAIAEGAIEECAKSNVKVSVAVVDRAGRMRVFLASDEANPHQFEMARRKAYTARTMRMPSLEWAKVTKDGSEYAPQRQLTDVIALGGGVPIKIGDDVIGAVGVSGVSQTGDDACARAGVAKVANQLAAN
jgi:uncharacterized protein GlcG (DUF336 family)